VTIRIGITGPIGCGKSTVASWLGERPGVVVIDADQVAREVVEPGEPALADIAERFGPEVLRADGSLDRSALGRIVFADPAALRDLEAITHPAVRPRILGAMEAAELEGADAVVVEAIRLVEGGLAALCDEVWLVTCDPAVQRERVVGRGTDPADAARRIEAQGDLTDRLRHAATVVIDTSGSIAEVRASVDAAYQASNHR
jgi:dephospho-CoA kinase